MYAAYIAIKAIVDKTSAPVVDRKTLAGGREVRMATELARGLAPPLILIVAVLGSILAGFATPTE